MAAPPPHPASLRPLGERARASAVRRHRGPLTAKARLGWTRRGLELDPQRDPARFGAERVATFLHAIATGPHGSAATQNEAPHALLAPDRDVCRPELQRRAAPVRASWPQRLPVMRSRDDVRAVIDPRVGVNRRMAALHSGAGPRRKSRCRLREKHVDFGRRLLATPRGTADRDRVAWLPGSLPSYLRAHLDAAREQHQAQIDQGAGRVALPNALDRKRPREGQAWAWQRRFPATRTSLDEATGPRRRDHLPETVRKQALKGAPRAPGIMRPATRHTIRRSFATPPLEAGTDSWTLHERLWHADVSPTIVYTAVPERRHRGGQSPLDRPGDLLRESARVGTAGLPNAAEVPRGDGEERPPGALRPGGAA
jgi:hypothetical protein